MNRSKKKIMRLLAETAILIGFSHSLSAVEFTVVETEEPLPQESELVLTYAQPYLNANDNAAAVAGALGFEDRHLGGIEHFYFANDSNADWRLYLDGRVFLQPEEIAVNIEAFKLDRLAFDLQFQHWIEYDHGAGIWYPPTDAYFLLLPDTLEEELNQLVLSITGTPSDTVSWKFKYRLFDRDGHSLSTVFGDNFQSAVGQAASRGIVPAEIDGRETIHRVEASIERHEGMDITGLNIFYQRREVDRKRVVERAASQPSANRFTRQEEDVVDDLLGFSTYARREFKESLIGSVGIAFTRLNGDLNGSRVFGADPDAAYDIDFIATQLNDRGFFDLTGGHQLKQWVLNANLLMKPEGKLKWVGGIRLEHLSTEAFGSYIDTVDRIDWGDFARQDQEALMHSVSDKTATDISAFLEMRYRSTAKSVLYSRLDIAHQNGDLQEGWTRQELVPNPGALTTLLDRATDFDRDRAAWEIVMHLNPRSTFRLSLEGYLKYRDNDYGYDDVVLAIDDLTVYPAYITQQNFYTRDLNLRANWRVHEKLKSVTRIDWQLNDIDTRDRLNPEVQSGENERVVFAQTLTWTPSPRFFATFQYNRTEDLTETPAADLAGSFSGIVVNLPSDYWEAGFDLYWVLNQLIDLQVGYTYLDAQNYIDTSPRTVPYGAELEQHHARIDTILHWSESLTMRLGYQYYNQADDAAAGNRDYSIHLLSTSLKYNF